MPAKTIDIHDVEQQLTELLSLVAQGTEVILVDAGVPVARLVPPATQATARIPGLHSGAIQTGDDFDQVLPDDFWLGSS